MPDHPLQEGILLLSGNPESSSLPQLSFRVLWQGKVGISSCRGSSGEAPPWDTQGDTGGGSDPSTDELQSEGLSCTKAGNVLEHLGEHPASVLHVYVP